MHFLYSKQLPLTIIQKLELWFNWWRYDLIDRDYDLIDGESLLSVVVGVVSLLDGKALDLHDTTFSVSPRFFKA